MATIRGLPVREPIAVAVMSVEELRVILAREIAKQLPPERLAGQTIAMQTLGVIPPGHDLIAGLEALLTEQIGGLYDEQTQRLFVMDWVNLDTQIARAILAHEITHALQDQHFDLGASPMMALDNDDAALAALALIEGDAMIAMSEWIVAHGNAGFMLEALQLLGMDQSALLSTPRFIQSQLLFPYLSGEGFAMRAHLRTRDHTRIDRLMADWPESTEQILHPERCALIGSAVDHPTPVTLDAAAWGVPRAWTRIESNVWGELGVRLIFEGPVGGRRAPGVGMGWDGDRWEVWRDPASGEAAFIWSTVWDTEADTEEFVAALDALGPRVVLGEVVDLDGVRVYPHPRTRVERIGATVHVAVWNDDDGVMLTPPPQTLDRVR